jgi:hypothetical protein
MTQLTFFAAEPPANRSASRACDRAWLTLGETSCSPSAPLLDAIAPAGLVSADGQVHRTAAQMALYDNGASLFSREYAKAHK